MTNLIAFILVFGLLIFVHELGHFLSARAVGARVLEFGFGFPPRLFGIKRGETLYSVNALPIGGFVKIAGEEDPSEPGSLASRSAPLRLLVLSSGALMNVLLAFFLLVVSAGVPREVVLGDVVVKEVMPGSPAYRAGMAVSDVIVGVNDRTIQNTADLSYNVHLNLGKETVFVVRRGGAFKELALVPRFAPPPGEGPAGIRIAMANARKAVGARPPWEAIPTGILKGFDILTISRNEVLSMLSRGVAPQVAGPVGIYQLTGEVAETGLSNLVEFAALLSLNLGVLNMLPVPMLDGGRVAFVLLEIVRGGRRIAREKESFVHFVGLVLLLTFMVVVSYYDVVRLVSGESFFP